MLQPWMLRKVIVWQSETDSNTFCPIRSMVDFTSTSNAMMGGNQMIPSRLNRFCCNYFKESPTIDYFPDDEPLIFLFGMRNQESVRRSGYKDIWKMKSGASATGLLFFQFVNGLSLISGFIFCRKILKSTTSIDTDMIALDVVLLVRIIQSIHGFLINTGIHICLIGGEISYGTTLSTITSGSL